jgi:hypothetical protein
VLGICGVLIATIPLGISPGIATAAALDTGSAAAVPRRLIGTIAAVAAVVLVAAVAVAVVAVLLVAAVAAVVLVAGAVLCRRREQSGATDCGRASGRAVTDPARAIRRAATDRARPAWDGEQPPARSPTGPPLISTSTFRAADCRPA